MSKEHHHLYGSWWKRVSEQHLVLNPWCVYCEEIGINTLAQCVDHKVPHRGNITLFRDPKNWQSLCFDCHNRIKKVEEEQGVLIGGDVNGDPLDPDHHWNGNSNGPEINKH